MEAEAEAGGGGSLRMEMEAKAKAKFGNSMEAEAELKENFWTSLVFEPHWKRKQKLMITRSGDSAFASTALAHDSDEPVVVIIFLVADMQLYKRLCPSVCPSVGPLISPCGYSMKDEITGPTEKEACLTNC